MQISDTAFSPRFMFNESFVQELLRVSPTPYHLLDNLTRFRAIRTASMVRAPTGVRVVVTPNSVNGRPFARYSSDNRFQMGAEFNVSNSFVPMDNFKLKGWTSLSEPFNGQVTKGKNLSVNYTFPTGFRQNLFKVFHKNTLSWQRHKTQTGFKLSWPLRQMSAAIFLEDEPTFTKRGNIDVLGVPKWRLTYKPRFCWWNINSLSGYFLGVLDAPFFEPNKFQDLFAKASPEWFLHLRSGLRCKLFTLYGKFAADCQVMFAYSNRFRDQTHHGRGHRPIPPPEARYRSNVLHRGIDMSLAWSAPGAMARYKSAFLTFFSLYSVEPKNEDIGPTQYSSAWGVGLQHWFRDDVVVEALLNCKANTLHIRVGKW